MGKVVSLAAHIASKEAAKKAELDRAIMARAKHLKGAR